MAEPKTRPTKASVTAFLGTIADAGRRADSNTVSRLMQQATKAKPVMLGANIVGFGSYDMVYADGTVRPWPIVAFSPRKTALVLYLTGGLKKNPALLAKLGKFKTGGGCLYLKTLADVDEKVLAQLIAASVKEMKKQRG